MVWLERFLRLIEFTWLVLQMTPEQRLDVYYRMCKMRDEAERRRRWAERLLTGRTPTYQEWK
jgi:hypothetical protein